MRKNLWPPPQSPVFTASSFHDVVVSSAAAAVIVAYNVACGQWATPEQIAEVLKPLNADIVLLSEVPVSYTHLRAHET